MRSAASKLPAKPRVLWSSLANGFLGFTFQPQEKRSLWGWFYVVASLDQVLLFLLCFLGCLMVDVQHLQFLRCLLIHGFHREDNALSSGLLLFLNGTSVPGQSNVIQISRKLSYLRFPPFKDIRKPLDYTATQKNVKNPSKSTFKTH